MGVRCRGHPNGGEQNDPAQEDVLRRLREQSLALQRQEMAADQHLRLVQDILRSMSDDEQCKKFYLIFFRFLTMRCSSRLAYITHDDVRRIECFREDTLLAVKAPFGSTLEVPDPDEGMPPGRRRYEIQLTSRTGPIDVFLIQDNPTPPLAPVLPNHVASSALDDEGEGTMLEGTTPDEMLLKHFQLPSDPYNFELKPGEGISDLYGFSDVFGGSFGVDLVSPAAAAPPSVQSSDQPNVKLSRE